MQKLQFNRCHKKIKKDFKPNDQKRAEILAGDF